MTALEKLAGHECCYSSPGINSRFVNIDENTKIEENYPLDLDSASHGA